VLVNVIAGLRAVDQDRLDLLGALAASRWQIFRYVRFPNSLPFIFAGLNTAIVFAVIGAIVGEFVGANRGLGFLILQANYQLDIAGAFALFAVLSILGICLHATLRFIERNWGLRPLSTRDARAGDITGAFDFARPPAAPVLLSAGPPGEGPPQSHAALVYAAYGAALALAVVVLLAAGGPRGGRRRGRAG
jgi:hypothetical protein